MGIMTTKEKAAHTGARAAIRKARGGSMKANEHLFVRDDTRDTWIPVCLFCKASLADLALAGEEADCTARAYIWLQTNEPRGEADCGCILEARGDGPAFYQCAMHANAAEVRDAMRGLLTLVHNLRDLIHGKEARQLDFLIRSQNVQRAKDVLSRSTQ